MGVLEIILLVFFVIIAILLVAMVLIQNEEGDSLGGIFAGSSGSAFGSRSGNILTKITTVLGSLFLIISLVLALINKDTVSSGILEEGFRFNQERLVDDDSQTDTSSENWMNRILNPQDDMEEPDAEYNMEELMEINPSF